MLLCPVRGCRLALVRDGRRLLCARAHSFDIARSGYINLLQPQDRRSRQPGDTRTAVAARRRLHDLGVTGPLLRAIAEMIAAQSSDVVLDAGCGDGFYLGTLAREAGFDAHGLDISTFAADAAARRYPPGDRREWIVANADRFVPYADRSFSIVLSITARMNVGEFRRILRDDGRLLVALPSPEDLAELRSRVGARTEPAQPSEPEETHGRSAEDAFSQARTESARPFEPSGTQGRSAEDAFSQARTESARPFEPSGTQGRSAEDAFSQAHTEPARPFEPSGTQGQPAKSGSVVRASLSREAGRDRVARTVETFAPGFTLADQRRITTSADLSDDAVRDVLVSIYRPMRSQPVEAMRVTFSLDLLLLRPR